jgi:hypothetical protein
MDFIALKGIPLSNLIYDDPSLREMMDIDILARYVDSRSIHCLLKDLRFIQTHKNTSLREDLLPRIQEKGIKRHVDDVKFQRGNSVLEVHFRLLSSKIASQPENEALFETSEKTDIGGNSVKILSPEFNMINLTTHCTYHNFGFGLRAISEIDGMTIHYGQKLDFNDLLGKIERYDLANLTYIPFALSKDLYDTPIPQDFLYRLEESCSVLFKRLSKRVLQNYFKRHEIPILRDSSLFLQILGQKSLFRSLSNIFLPSRDMLRIMKGDHEKNEHSFIFLYVRRIIYLTKTYVPRIFRSFFDTLRVLYGKHN